MNRLTHWWIKLGCDLRGETLKQYSLRRTLAAINRSSIAMRDTVSPALLANGILLTRLGRGVWGRARHSDEVTGDMRHTAMAANYGTVYGRSRSKRE